MPCLMQTLVSNHRDLVEEATEAAIAAFAIERGAFGRVRVVNELQHRASVFSLLVFRQSG
jgi:hypothetical protein